jgi:hypothetical protein
VVLVSQLPQPWRGIVDAGVVVGLVWGMTSVVCHLISQVYGFSRNVDPELPEAD